jgi:hypothetical protein
VVGVLDVSTAAAPVADRPRQVARVRLPPLLLVGLAYLAVSLGLQHRVLGAFTTSTIGDVTGDPDLFAWWLTWTPWAVLHGQNPLVTNWLHYPLGVNGMWNTTVPLLGVLLAPVTLAAGPVASYNAGMILGPVVSGVALAWALGPWVRRWPARAVAGAMYAFGPFLVAHASAGHLNLVWSVFPPVLLRLVHVLFVRGPRRPYRTGALVGLVLAAQTLLYTQTLALGVLMLVVTAVVLAIRFPARVRPALPGLVRAGAACVGVYAVVCAYPLWLILAGPQRPRSTIRDPLYGVTDLANVVVPTPLTALRLVPHGIADTMRANVGEQGGYLGPAMIVLVAVLVVVVRSTPLRIAATVGLVSLVLSLGPSLVVADHETGFPLPWTVLSPVPLLGEAEPVRLQAVTLMCVAMVVGIWLDRLTSIRRLAGVGAASLATAFALLTLLPAGAYAAREAATPTFFAHAAQHLRPGDVVETVPAVTSVWDGGARPMRWQAQADMGYKIVGGYFIGSDAANDVLIEAPVTPYQRGVDDIAARRPVSVPASAAAESLRAAGVTVVVVVPEPDRDTPAVLAWTAAATGVTGTPVDDAWVFRL